MSSEEAQRVYEKIMAIRLAKDLKKAAREEGHKTIRPRMPGEMPALEGMYEESDIEILSELRSKTEDT